MNTFSLSALVCRVLCVVYFLVALSTICMVGLLRMRPESLDGFVSLSFLLMGGACFWAAYLMSNCAGDNQQAANTKAQHAAEAERAYRESVRDNAFLSFVELGMDDELASKLANHDVLTLEAALDVERAYRERGVSYHPWLAYRLTCYERFGAWCTILPEDVAMPMVVNQWRFDVEPMQDDTHLHDEEYRRENMRGAAAAGDEWAQALLQYGAPDDEPLLEDLLTTNGRLTPAEAGRVAEYEQNQLDNVHPWVQPRGCCTHPALANDELNDLPF